MGRAPTPGFTEGFSRSNVTVYPMTSLLSSLSPPSLHPTLFLQLNATQPATSSPFHSSLSQCSIYIRLSLPDSLFLDPSELGDSFLSQSKVNVTRWTTTPEVVNIERPFRCSSSSRRWFDSPDQLEENYSPSDQAGGTEGEGMTLDLVLAGAGDTVELSIPMHVRYLHPNERGWQEVRLFGDDGEGQIGAGWVCDDSSPDYGERLSGIPPLPSSGVPGVSLILPTGIASHQPFVELGTAGAMWLGFGYLAWKLLRLSRRLSGQAPKRGQ